MLYDTICSLGFAHECRFFPLAPASIKVKRGKFGKSRGKSIDPNVSFNYWNFETLPATRKGTTIVFVFVFVIVAGDLYLFLTNEHFFVKR